MTDSRHEQATEALHKFLIIYRYLRKYARQMDTQGIRPREFSVLRYLWETGPANVGQVQEYLYCSPSTASTVIAQLEAAGYVTRTRSDEDNRVVVAELTASGRAIAERADMGGIPLLRRRLPTLPAKRIANIDRALADLIDLMEVTEDE